MKFEKQRRMRLTLHGSEVEHVAQLRAYFSEESNKATLAHEVIKEALSQLHHDVFVKRGNPIPEEWRAYER